MKTITNDKNTRICIVGDGAFGTAILHLLQRKGFNPVVWSLGDDYKTKISFKEYVIFAVPAQVFREVLTNAAPYIGNAIIVNLAKGIEIGSMLRLSQVANEVIPGCNYVALSGPSHAEEVELGMPTNVTVSSLKPSLLPCTQDLFFCDNFRVYTNADIVGVELGATVKNVIALATGIADGMGYGDNARAALMTRGLAEIRSLGEAMGANPLTFLGLAGVGDLIVTCGSMHSRNRRCGILLGQKVPVDDAIAQVGQVVEGITSCYAVHEMSLAYNVEMPITNVLYKFLKKEISLDEAVNLLMSRARRSE